MNVVDLPTVRIGNRTPSLKFKRILSKEEYDAKEKENNHKEDKD